MNIVILTQPLRTNYGGILQDYALQTVLRKMGHTPITIDYACRYPKWRWFLGRIKSIIKGTDHNYDYPRYGRQGQSNLNRFIHKYISLTNPVDVPTKALAENLHPRTIIVGSDQVWSPWANVPLDFLGNMYLDFIPDYKGKRIAYAASFGSGEWTYTPEWTEKCSKLAKRFDAISVREDSGVKLCKEHLGVDATHVLDPTLLLTGADYDKLLKGPAKKNNILFAYVLDTTPEKKEFLNSLAKKFGHNLIIKGANEELESNDSVERWMMGIRDAAMVVTDSFHGSVFSILFHRPFLSIVNNRRGADRFTSLLSKLGLMDRLVNESTDISNITNDIDWEQVESKLSLEREISMNFLKNAL